jgi:cytochrome c peroxidase
VALRRGAASGERRGTGVGRHERVLSGAGPAMMAEDGGRQHSFARAPRVALMLRRLLPAVTLVLVMLVVVADLRPSLANEVDTPAETTAADGATPAARLPPRPERSADERSRLAAELREIYSGDPADWPSPHADAGVAWREIGRLPAVEHPADNPHSLAKEQLGRMLFFDPRLSGSGQMACASCHDPDLGWADGRTTSFGHSRKHLARNAPTVRNSAFQTRLFWDGRAASLEEQAQAVLANPDEMRADPEQVVKVLEAEPEYRKLFGEAFGDERPSIERAAAAIACFERTVVGGGSRFDAFLKGNRAALGDEAILGLDLFRREARCINCHHGPAFSDGGFHDLGLSNYGRPFEDLGRGKVTGDPGDTGKFRTPTLRDVTATAPYMHNGLFELEVALTLYNAGMPTAVRKQGQEDDPAFPVKSPLLKSLGLNKQDLADLTAFLESLEEPKRRVRPPALPGLDVSRDAN